MSPSLAITTLPPPPSLFCTGYPHYGWKGGGANLRTPRPDSATLLIFPLVLALPCFVSQQGKVCSNAAIFVVGTPPVGQPRALRGFHIAPQGMAFSYSISLHVRRGGEVDAWSLSLLFPNAPPLPTHPNASLVPQAPGFYICGIKRCHMERLRGRGGTIGNKSD